MEKDGGNRFENWPIEDLRLVRGESGVDENGEAYWMVFSEKLDALTPVGEGELVALKRRGLIEIDDLPG